MGIEQIARIFMGALVGKLGRLTARAAFRHLSGPLFGVALLLFTLALLRYVGVQWPNFLHSWLTLSVPLSPLK